MKGHSQQIAGEARRKPGRPRSKKSEEAIINATTKLLNDEGYAKLTVGKVAAYAKASNRAALSWYIFRRIWSGSPRP